MFETSKLRNSYLVYGSFGKALSLSFLSSDWLSRCNSWQPMRENFRAKRVWIYKTCSAGKKKQSIAERLRLRWKEISVICYLRFKLVVNLFKVGLSIQYFRNFCCIYDEIFGVLKEWSDNDVKKKKLRMVIYLTVYRSEANQVFKVHNQWQIKTCFLLFWQHTLQVKITVNGGVQPPHSNFTSPKYIFKKFR